MDQVYGVGDVIRVIKAAYFPSQAIYVGQFGVVTRQWPGPGIAAGLVFTRMLHQEDYRATDLAWALHEIEKITDPGLIVAAFLGE